MRTTLDLDDDVLHSAKEIARREKKTAGQVLSELARRALTQGAVATRQREPAAVHGFRPFAARGGVVTSALVRKLSEEGEY
jgi:predicted transcriptional regulator